VLDILVASLETTRRHVARILPQALQVSKISGPEQKFKEVLVQFAGAELAGYSGRRDPIIAGNVKLASCAWIITALGLTIVSGTAIILFSSSFSWQLSSSLRIYAGNPYAAFYGFWSLKTSVGRHFLGSTKKAIF
jgi:hypothetical protein